jgi:hypothetical protein
MSEINTVSPLRQRMIEDMAARKLNPHTQRTSLAAIANGGETAHERAFGLRRHSEKDVADIGGKQA